MHNNKTNIISYFTNICYFIGTVNAVEEKAAPYHLYSGLIIERRPVVTAELTDLEKRYLQLQQTIEVEKSHYSKHELRHKADL